MPVGRTSFENFLFHNFGIYTDLSNNVIVAVVAIVAVGLLLKKTSLFSLGLR